MRRWNPAGVVLILVSLIAIPWACGGGGGGGGGGGPDPNLPTADSFEPNDACSEARPMALPLALQDLSIHNPATDDFYKVALEGPDTLTVTVSFVHASGNLDLELWDATCGALLGSSTTSLDSEQIVLGLSAGDYLIRVYTLGPATNRYDLDVSTSGGAGGLMPDAREPNEDAGGCTPMVLPFVDTALSIHGALDRDVFCFQLAAAAKVTVELRFVHALGDIDVTLWQRSPPRLLAGSTSGTNDEKIFDPVTGEGVDLSAGNYFVQVEGAFGDTNVYELFVTQN